MDFSKVDWWDTTIGAIGGAFTAVLGLFGWFTKKLDKVNKRIEDLQAASTACLIAQSAQRQMHLDNQRRLGSIERGIQQLLSIQLNQAGAHVPRAILEDEENDHGG